MLAKNVTVLSECFFLLFTLLCLSVGPSESWCHGPARGSRNEEMRIVTNRVLMLHRRRRHRKGHLHRHWHLTYAITGRKHGAEQTINRET